MNRRHFLQSTAALAATTAAGYAQDLAERRYKVGLIGCGWYGKCDLFRLIQVSPVEVVALCDVDRTTLNGAADLVQQRQANHRRPALYGDYREMLRAGGLDIVLIGTPDHWHALPMIAAVEAGHHVWVQKPISVDIDEGKAMVAAARRANKVVQVGLQRRSTPHLVEARDRILRENKLGKIAHVDIYCYYHMRASENPPDAMPPANLDYEMWTGPAPRRPYNNLVHSRKWRAYMEYGNGIVGDMCVHMFDMVRWMMDLGWPRSVSSAGGIYVDRASRANITDTQSATFDFGDLTVDWIHRTWGAPADPRYPWGATFYGDRGTLKASVHRYDFTPLGAGNPASGQALIEPRFTEDRTERDIEIHVASAIRRHHQDFLRAIANNARPVADIEQGHISTASCILANLSQRFGRTLRWDSTAQRIVGDDEANRALRRPYRQPWVHPGA
ncbi:MAG TPA: Gfo/Idh/MocA family oxidoreductase [Gemmataceae bacterium]|nr:Gfo/Idh/MocA family oxidoreductase [Gemmataceae bacterium]